MIVSSSTLISEYSKHVLDHDKCPSSIFSFCKKIEIEEKDFYKYFSSFNSLESGVFESFLEQTVNLLHASEEYASYDSKTKLLSFYFTFFELLTANRSFVLYLLGKDMKDLKNMKKLKPFRLAFLEYISSLDIETVNIPNEKIEKIQSKTISEGAWFQFMLTLSFWKEDSSSSFEKTDVFIEKSVQASFDLIDISPLKNIIDFGKFLWKEKMR